jgi:WD40 repeat protein
MQLLSSKKTFIRWACPIVFSPDGSLIAWVRGRGVVHVDCTETLEKRVILQFEGEHSPYIMRISYCNRYLVGLQSGAAYLHTIDRVSARLHIGGGKDWFPTDAAFSPDSQILALAHEKGIKLWCIATQKFRISITAYRPYDMVFSHDSLRLAAVYGINRVNVWASGGDGEVVETIQREDHHHHRANGLVFTRNNELIVGWDDATLLGKEQYVGPPLLEGTKLLYSVQTGQLIYSGRKIWIWDIERGKYVGEPFWGGDEERVSVSSKDGTLLKAVAEPKTLKVYSDCRYAVFKFFAAMLCTGTSLSNGDGDNAILYRILMLLL